MPSRMWLLHHLLQRLLPQRACPLGLVGEVGQVEAGASEPRVEQPVREQAGRGARRWVDVGAEGAGGAGRGELVAEPRVRLGGVRLAQALQARLEAGLHDAQAQARPARVRPPEAEPRAGAELVQQGASGDARRNTMAVIEAWS